VAIKTATRRPPSELILSRWLSIFLSRHLNPPEQAGGQKIKTPLVRDAAEVTCQSATTKTTKTIPTASATANFDRNVANAAHLQWIGSFVCISPQTFCIHLVIAKKSLYPFPALKNLHTSSR
jgi:hypothetical protein